MELSELIQEMFKQCKSLNLLYVEDDAEISAVTVDMLKPFFNTVTMFSDGAQGLAAFEKGEYDIVLTDIKMPVMDGCVMSKKIRQINPDQAIIVMSAFEEIDLFREFIEIGISKFIPKPPVFKHLLNSFVTTATYINNAKQVTRLTQELQKDFDEKKEILARIIDTVPVRIFWKDRNSRYLGCNTLCAQDAGLETPVQIIGKTDFDLAWKNEATACFVDDQLVMSEESAKLDYEVSVIHENGSIQYLSMSKVPLRGEGKELIGILGAYIDITAQKETVNEIQSARDALGYQAQHDVLTGLPNRVLYMDRLNHAIDKATRTGDKLAVLFLDLDRFKQINDSLGHEVGDKIVTLLGERLFKILRTEDTIARFGGDEFTVLLEDITQISDVSEIASKIIQALDEPFNIDNHQMHLTLSAGISIYPDDGDSAEILIRNADTAMYRAKDEGRNAYTFYSREMTENTLFNMTMAKNIRNALNVKEFEVYYQPQIDAVTQKLIGMEALLRWQTINGFISPAVFIPIAEDAGLIDKIGEFVFTEATSQMVKWYGEGYKPGRVAINLSTIELQKESFVETVIQRLADVQCKSDWIELEITEGYTMKHANTAIQMLQKLKDLGIHLSIDDFGTGYSSLSYLQKLPIHKLKIDQSFVRDIPNNINGEAIVKSIIFLAKTMKFDVIAEGVETKAQQDYLVSKGCRLIQGYFNGKPMPASEMEVFMKSHT
jgi:diguanylate cyclase (GGDEF)-like protein/PAS domain S-box-containing protein